MHYVMSDIHGQYDYFLDILKKINFSDEDILYVNGDVIDRGDQSIKLLQYILSKPNIVLLIGNHEHLMLQALLEKDDDAMYIWSSNGNEKTLKQFEELPFTEQYSILYDLIQCPIVIPNLSVNDKQYYIAHATHLDYYYNDILLYKDANTHDRERVLWSREYANNMNPTLLYNKFHSLYALYKDTTLLIGHTPVFKCSYGQTRSGGLPKISKAAKGHLINLDCGCARQLPLGCLCLETGEEFYADLPKGLSFAV